MGVESEAQRALRRAGTRSFRPLGGWVLLGGALAAVFLAVSALRIYEVITYMMVVGDDFRAYWNGAISVAAGQSPYSWLSADWV